MSTRINKGLIVGGNTIVTQAAWNAELDAKNDKLVEWLKAQGLAGVLIRLNENVAWLTGGAGVAEIPQLQKLLRFICREGFEHHVAANFSDVSKAVHEAARYLGWESHYHPEC